MSVGLRKHFAATAFLAPILAPVMALSSLPLFAQEIANEGPVATTALINAESKNDAKLDPTLLKLEVNGREAPITSVVQVRPGTAQVAILIDDGLRSSFGLQLRDMEQFLKELPPGVQVLIGYLQNGTVRTEQNGFSSDHETVAKALRLPLSAPGISASPYFGLSEFVKHWPSNQPGARIVLMLTNGVDPYNGSVSPLNQDSPYVQTAQDDAQRAGAAVYAIYYGDRGTRGGLASFSGQSYLQQVAEATGAQSFYNGTITPPSLLPYLNQFRKAIAESYQVSFLASTTREKRDTLTRIKLKTSQRDVKVHAPDAVHPGLSEGTQ